MHKLYTTNPDTGRWQEVKHLLFAKEIRNLNGFLIENPDNILASMHQHSKNSWLVWAKEGGARVVHDEINNALQDFTEVIGDVENV